MRNPALAQPSAYHNLPRPPVPADIDLRSNDWFPFKHKRLRRSDFWQNCSPLAAKVSVELWCEAYEQVPAGSLPDDDRFLSDQCGFGRHDLTAWLAIKDEVMSAWELCSDGRWYHPTLCEVVLETLDKQSGKREQARIRQQRRRERLKLEKEGGGDVTRDENVVESPEHKGDEGVEDSRHAESRSNKTEQDSTGEGEAGASRQLALIPEPEPDPVRQVYDLWIALADETGLPKVKWPLSEDRRKAIKARLKDEGLEGVEKALAAVKVSRWCRGNNPSGWVASLDYVLQRTSFRKLLAGQLGADHVEGQANGQQRIGAGGRRSSRVDGFRRFDASVRGGPDEG